jgi:hypothetical protein
MVLSKFPPVLALSASFDDGDDDDGRVTYH